MVVNEIKIRLLRLEKRQVDLLDAIRKRGFKNLQPSTLSQYISGTITGPQAETVIKIIYEILASWEEEKSTYVR